MQSPKNVNEVKLNQWVFSDARDVLFLACLHPPRLPESPTFGRAMYLRLSFPCLMAFA